MAGTFEESISDVDSELGLTGGPLELNEANVLAVQDQLKAEIASLQKWLAECDPHSEESNSNVVKEVEFACKQSSLLLQEFDEAVQQYQLAQRKGRALPPDEVAKFEQFGFIVSSMQLGEGDSASDELSEPQSVSCDSASVAEGAHSAEAESGHQHSQEELDEPTKTSQDAGSATSNLHSIQSGTSSEGSSEEAAPRSDRGLSEDGSQHGLVRTVLQSVSGAGDAQGGGLVRGALELQRAQPQPDNLVAHVRQGIQDINGDDVRLKVALKELRQAQRGLQDEDESLLNITEDVLDKIVSSADEGTGGTEAMQRLTQFIGAAKACRSQVQAGTSPEPIEAASSAIVPCDNVALPPPQSVSEEVAQGPASSGSGSGSAVMDVANAMLQEKNHEVQALRDRLAQRDDLVKELQAKLAQQDDRVKYLTMQVEQTTQQLHSSEATMASSDAAMHEALREALDKVNHLEIDNENLVKACNAATGDAHTLRLALDDGESHRASRRNKEELLESIDLIAKSENGLLRSIISQLKDEIAQRIELHSDETMQLRRALAEAQQQCQQDLCGAGTNFKLRDLEEELLAFGEDLEREADQKGWYAAEEPSDALDQAVAKVLSSLACPVRMELKKVGLQGEYLADRKLKLVLRNGQVLVRQGTGYESLLHYMEALYEPFIHNIDTRPEELDLISDATYPAAEKPEPTRGRSLSKSPPRSYGRSPPRAATPSPPQLSSPTPASPGASQRNPVESTSRMPVSLDRMPSINMPVSLDGVLNPQEDRPKRLKDRVLGPLASGLPQHQPWSRRHRTQPPQATHVRDDAHSTLVHMEDDSNEAAHGGTRVLEHPHTPHFEPTAPSPSPTPPLHSTPSPHTGRGPLGHSPTDDVWGSPASISPVSSSASELHQLSKSPEEVSPIGHGHMQALHTAANRNRHLSAGGLQIAPSLQGSSSKPTSQVVPRIPLHQSQSHNKPVESDRGSHLEDEVRVRALKKFALRKQFEQHRKERQQQETKTSQRGGIKR